jgi:hypothetical protein
MKPQLRGQIGVDTRSALACTRKILDIFVGTQQIQQLIVACRLLGKTSGRAEIALCVRDSRARSYDDGNICVDICSVKSGS